jgi:hypothetical protein
MLKSRCGSRAFLRIPEPNRFAEDQRCSNEEYINQTDPFEHVDGFKHEIFTTAQTDRSHVRACQSRPRVSTHPDSLNTASSISQWMRWPPAPPRRSGTPCSLMRAQRPSKNGFVPGMPTVHQLRTKRSNVSYRSFCAAHPEGSARDKGVNDPPGRVADRCALNSAVRRALTLA